MPRRVSQAQAVREAVRVAAKSPHRTVWIGVDGPAGAGKTTLASRIATAIDRAVVVAIDDFSGPRIAEWDIERLHEQLTNPLIQGRPARFQRWDWDRDEGTEWVDVQPATVVIIEGVSATRAEVTVPWALKIWVDTPRELRRARTLHRAGPAMASQWLAHWIPSEEAYIAAQRPQVRADLIVRGDEPAD
jgi:uridine kinase